MARNPFSRREVMKFSNRFERDLLEYINEIRKKLSRGLKYPKRILEKKLNTDMTRGIIRRVINLSGIKHLIERNIMPAAGFGVDRMALRLKKKPKLTAKFNDKMERRIGELSKHIQGELQKAVSRNLMPGIRARETVSELTKRVGKALRGPLRVKIKAKVIRGEIVRKEHYRTLSKKVWARTIARTETNKVFQESIRDAYERAGIKKFTWYCGPNPCPICIERCDNEYYKSELDRMDWPPLHPHCQCKAA